MITCVSIILLYGKVIYCRTLEIQILDEEETVHTQKDVFTIIWYLKLSVYVACKKKLNINCTITTKYATGLSLDVSYIQINKKKLNAYYIYFKA